MILTDTQIDEVVLEAMKKLLDETNTNTYIEPEIKEAAKVLITWYGIYGTDFDDEGPIL